MTIEEKRKAIERYCDTQPSCDGCKLECKPTAGNCYSPDTDPIIDAKVEANYAFLFGGGDHTNKPITRAEILEAAAKIVSGHRVDEYGSPEDNFTTIALLWDTYIAANCMKNDHLTITAQDVAAMLILLKIGRLGSGAGSADCWIDIAGYAACGGEIATIGGDKS